MWPRIEWDDSYLVRRNRLEFANMRSVVHCSPHEHIEWCVFMKILQRITKALREDFALASEYREHGAKFDRVSFFFCRTKIGFCYTFKGTFRIYNARA